MLRVQLGRERDYCASRPPDMGRSPTAARISNAATWLNGNACFYGLKALVCRSIATDAFHVSRSDVQTVKIRHDCHLLPNGLPCRRHGSGLAAKCSGPGANALPLTRACRCGIATEYNTPSTPCRHVPVHHRGAGR